MLAAAVLTALALLFREPLTVERLSLKPEANGSAYFSYVYGDGSNGGSSTAREDSKRPLTWSCDLTTNYAYGYCGFGLLFDVSNSGRGLDLRRFDRVRVKLDYEGPGRSLRIALKNRDQRYLALGAPSAEKVNQSSLFVRPGKQNVELNLHQLTVAEWWRDNASRPSPKLAMPEYGNVLSLEVLTGVESRPGRHRLVLTDITFEGNSVSSESWYGAIALAWLLLIGGVLVLRRKERVSWQEKLAEGLQTRLDKIPHMVWSLEQGRGIHFNARWEDFTDLPLGSNHRANWMRLMHPDELRAVTDAWNECAEAGEPFEVECRMQHRSGDYRWVLARAVPAVDASGRVTGWYGSCTDIHDRVTAQRALVESVASERQKSQQLKWASEHDALTCLPNRRAFQAQLEDATSRAIETGEIGLLLIDLDHFKHTNDSLGHSAGDVLLKTVAERLRASVRRADFVARIGGDEFAVLVENVRCEDDLLTACNSVIAAIQAPVRLDDHVVRPGASIGGAMFPEDARNADDFFKAADAALYALKRSGRGGFRLFRSHMLQEVKRAALQLGRAREVVADNSITAVYQPKVDVRSGSVVGFEALLRYRGVDGELGLPDELEEAFKDYELAARIGEQMQRRVARDIRTWLDSGLSFGRVSINAAPAEFLRDDYAERLLAVLGQHDVPAVRIEVEVTEHAFLDRGPEHVARALHALKAAGANVSLDDFGTGHSSLSHMRDFPVDLIKVDKSFVQQIAEDEEIAALVAGVIHLARSLGLDVVAEGVETPQQLALLRSMACQFAQGYLFGAPVEPAAVATRLCGASALSVA